MFEWKKLIIKYENGSSKRKSKYRYWYNIFEIYKKTARFENQKNISLKKRNKQINK